MISIKTYKALLQNAEFAIGNIPETLNGYNKLLDSLVYIQETITSSIAKKPVHEQRLMPIITKFSLHCYSIVHLVSGYDIETKGLDKKARVIDIVSLNIILRAQIETLLMFEFIYIQSRNDDEIEFRYCNWMYSGLLNRVSLINLDDIDKRKEEVNTGIEEKLRTDQLDIAEFAEKLRTSSLWDSFTEKQQTSILEKGVPRLFNNSWRQIMLKANWKSQFGVKLYSRLSAHSHTEGLGIMNLEGSKLAYNDKHKGGFLALFTSKVYLAAFIEHLMEYNDSFRFQYDIKFHNLLSDIKFLSAMLYIDSKP